MFSGLPLPIANWGVPQSSSSNFRSSATAFRWRSLANRDQWMTRNHAIRVLANPHASPEKGRSSKEVIMVDPLEAKRLAAKQMQQIKAKEKLKKRRRIEAINGAWAMIGLTAGLVIEGHTGKSILDQLTGYWAAFFSFFFR